MVERILTVVNRAGIHARPAALIVKVANRYTSDVFFTKDTMRINGKSIMGVITLGATYKSQLTMQCEGPDETEMADAIEHVFTNHFEE